MSWRSSGKHNCGSKAGAAAGEERFGKPGAETASGNQNRAQCLCGKHPGDGDGLPQRGCAVSISAGFQDQMWQNPHPALISELSLR